MTMVPPVLEPLALELADTERLRAFQAAGPGTAARVSETLLPLFLAACRHAFEREGGLVCLLPEDADARDAAEAAGWYLGPDRVGLLTSRGVSFESGLAPPPHLVGERARALEVFERGGLVCASALGFAQGLPPPELRTGPVEIAVGDEPGVEGLAELVALAGYERVDRVE